MSVVPPTPHTGPSDSTPALAGVTDADELAQKNIRLTGQVPGRRFVATYIAALVGLWIALLTPASVTLAVRIADLDPAGKAGSLALVTGVGALFAMVSNPLFGHLSDRSASRFGQRRPFLLAGTVGGGLATLLIGVAPNIGTVLVGWCLVQIGFNAALAALVAVFPERVPAELRGRVSGLMGTTSQIAQVTGTVLIQFTGTAGMGMFVLPAVLGLIPVVVFVCHLREVPRRREDLPGRSLRGVLTSMWISPRRYPDFAWAFASRFLVWTAVALLTTYKTYFLMDRVGLTSAEAARTLVATMGTLAVTVIIGSTLGGWLTDRAGRRKIFILGSSFVYAAGMVVIAGSHSVTGFLVGVAVAGIGQGVYQGVDYALVAAVLPRAGSDAAKGMGVFNIANALPQTVAPAIAPVLLLIGGGGNYTALYLGAAIFAVAGALAIQLVRAVR